MKASVQRKIKNTDLTGSYTKKDVLSLISIVCRSAEELFGIKEDYNRLRIRISGTIGPYETDIRDFVLNTELFDTDDVIANYSSAGTEINIVLPRNDEALISIRSENHNAIELLKAMESMQNAIDTEFEAEKGKVFDLPPEEKEIEVLVREHEKDKVVAGLVDKRKNTSRREELRRVRREEEKRRKKTGTYIAVGVGIAVVIAVALFFILKK